MRCLDKTHLAPCQLPRGACFRQDRRAGSGLRRGAGRNGAGFADGLDFNLYGLQNFSAANYLQSANPGGEPGVSSGFVIPILFVVTSQGVASASRVLHEHWPTGAAAGWSFVTAGTNTSISFSCFDNTGTNKTSGSYTFTASDVGRVMLAIGQNTGSGVQLLMYRGGLVGATAAALPSYTPGSARTMLGVRGAGTLPSDGLSVLAVAGATGTPSLAQLQAYYDAARVLGDLPDTMQGATVTHLSSLKRELLGVTNPAGRKTYGARAFTSANNFIGAASQGVRGSTGGFCAPISVRFDAIPSGAQILMSCIDATASTGWHLQANGAVLRFILCPSTVSATYTLTASDIGRDLLIIPHFTGTQLRLYVGRTQIGADVAGSFLAAGAGDRFYIGSSTVALPATAMSIFEMAGGNVNPSLATIQQCFDDFDRTGRIVPFSGLDHFYSLTTDIVANALAMPATLIDRIGTDTLTRAGTLEVAIDTATAPPCPLQLTDRITAASADALARVGAPTVRIIDPTIDGRRTLGAQGFSAANYLQTAAGGGIHGSAANGLNLAVRVTLSSVPSVSQVIAHCIDSSGSFGWYLQALANGTVRYVSSAGVSSSYTVTTGDVGIPILFQVTQSASGGPIKLYKAGVQAGADVIAGAYTPASGSVAMVIGHDQTSAAPFLGSVWEVCGGDFSATLAEIQQQAADTERTGYLVGIPGKTAHLYVLTTDILASGVDAVPATVLDRVGTDHLTRVGIDVHTDANAIRGVGPYSAADLWQTAAGGGIQGANSFHAVLDVWLTKVPGTEVIASASAGATGWYVAAVSGALQIVLLTKGASNTYAIAAGDLNKRLRLVISKTATTLELVVNGTSTGQVAIASFAANAATVTMVIGAQFGSGTAPFVSGYVEAVVGGNVALSAGNITAYNADLTQAPPTIAGVTLKRYIFEQDIAAAVSGALPARSVERISGGDDMVRIGSPLTLAQRTERVWSYETAPILQSVEGFTTANGYSTTGGPVGSFATGLHVAILFRITAQVAGTRVYFEKVNAGFLGGWGFNTTGVNSILNFVCYNAAGGSSSATGVSLAASDIGKLFLAIGQIDLSSGTPTAKMFVRRASTGNGNALASWAPPTQPLTVGNRYGGTFGAPDTGILGVMGGGTYLTNNECLALHDAVMSGERILGVAGKTSWLVDFKQDVDANAGALPATLLDRIGSSNLVRAGSPTLAPVYARAWGV